MGCELADTFALVVQGLLGVLALLSLVWKRYIESPPRPLITWLMDTSKQVTGGGTAHVTNVLLGILMEKVGGGGAEGAAVGEAHGAVADGAMPLSLAAAAPGDAPATPYGDSALDGARGAADAGADANSIDAGGSDQCVWYLVFLTLECTLGVLILCTLLYALNYAAERHFFLKHFVSGEYGEPPRVKLWLKQLVAYQALLLMMKVCLALLVLPLHDVLRTAGRALLAPLEPFPRIQLLLVMVVVPLVLTVFSFWIQDNVLMSAAQFEMMADPEAGSDEARAAELAGTQMAAGHVVARRAGSRPALSFLDRGLNSSAGLAGLATIAQLRSATARVAQRAVPRAAGVVSTGAPAGTGAGARRASGCRIELDAFATSTLAPFAVQARARTPEPDAVVEVDSYAAGADALSGVPGAGGGTRPRVVEGACAHAATSTRARRDGGGGGCGDARDASAVRANSRTELLARGGGSSSGSLGMCDGVAARTRGHDGAIGGGHTGACADDRAALEAALSAEGTWPSLPRGEARAGAACGAHHGRRGSARAMPGGDLPSSSSDGEGGAHDGAGAGRHAGAVAPRRTRAQPAPGAGALPADGAALLRAASVLASKCPVPPLVPASMAAGGTAGGAALLPRVPPAVHTPSALAWAHEPHGFGGNAPGWAEADGGACGPRGEAAHALADARGADGTASAPWMPAAADAPAPPGGAWPEAVLLPATLRVSAAHAFMPTPTRGDERPEAMGAQGGGLHLDRLDTDGARPGGAEPEGREGPA
ncbi:hypothetical protein KFE25_011210 [Diacronema lutheri]|uniref:Uncharacterized protein n=2 Tax=Diacronema lutheri TaxID=2081491 RepID=A0A8J5XFQ2_DIALT|nr:hypothetical protein KFE25_011210 [Diacronema lutheri]